MDDVRYGPGDGNIRVDADVPIARGERRVGVCGGEWRGERGGNDPYSDRYGPCFGRGAARRVFLPRFRRAARGIRGVVDGGPKTCEARSLSDRGYDSGERPSGARQRRSPLRAGGKEIPGSLCPPRSCGGRTCG